MSGRRLMMILLFWCVAGTGCSDKYAVPGGILSKDKMEKVMWDMAQADQYAALYVAKDSVHVDRKAETLRLYAEVFRLHQVTADEFRKSYRYYLAHPELNQLLFDSVIARGVRARAELYDRPGIVVRTPVAPVNLAKPGVLAPGRPDGVLPVRPGGVLPGRPGGVIPGRPGGVIPGRPGVVRPKRDTTAGKKGRP